MSDSVEATTRSRRPAPWDRHEPANPTLPMEIRPAPPPLGPAAAPSSNGRTLSAALAATLGQRVKVASPDGPRWMSGYDAIVLVLRNRAAEGDMVAARMLADFSKCADLIAAERFDRAAGISPQTAAEKELADAFVERSRERAPLAMPLKQSRARKRRRNGGRDPDPEKRAPRS